MKTWEFFFACLFFEILLSTASYVSHQYSITMHPLFLLTSLLLPFTLATPLTPAESQSLSLTSLDLVPLSPTMNNTTDLGANAKIGCFKPTKIPPFTTTDKPACEAALDSWVRGQSLLQSRTFSRRSATVDDVQLPFERVSGSCSVYVNVIDEDDEDVLTLAELYAEVLGPDGVMKNCLGQLKMPAIGGRMSIGAKGLVNVVVTGA